ncbi:MAG: hypothetical protein ACREA0_35115, partial [bacterium]
DDTVQVLDPPSPPDRQPVDTVARESGGVVLFVEADSVRQAEEIVRREKLVSLAKYCGLSLASGLAVLVVYAFVQRSAAKRTKES